MVGGEHHLVAIFVDLSLGQHHTGVVDQPMQRKAQLMKFLRREPVTERETARDRQRDRQSTEREREMQHLDAASHGSQVAQVEQ
jgi:hypothetical protein